MSESKKILEETRKNAPKVIWKDRKHILWFPIGFTKYALKDDDRLYIDKGILNTVSDQTLLYRITDMQLSRSFGQKLCGTGTVVLVSKVDVEHQIVLKNIKKSNDVLSMFSRLVEEARERKNLIGKEFYSRGSGLDHPDYDPDFDGSPSFHED